MVRRPLLLYNPTAGRRRQERLLPRLLAVLRGAGITAEARATGAPGDASLLAREAARAGEHDGVLVLGGDGTVREAAKGLQGSRLPLGVLPGGTANVLARALGLPGDPMAVAAALPWLTVRDLDVGLCGATPFLMMASVGLDAVVVARLRPDLKARLGRAGVVLQALREWWRYDYPQLEVQADGEASTATLAVVANIPLYGGAVTLAPAARYDDGALDLVTFEGRGRLAALAFAVDLLRGRHLDRADVRTRRVQEVLLTAPASACLQVDGDVCAEALPARVKLAASPLRVLAPGG